jgi:glycine hydroxymethyltransferase
MVSHAVTLASALAEHALPVFTTALAPTTSHQFALDAGGWGGGQAAAQRLGEANIVTCDRPAMGACGSARLRSSAGVCPTPA